LDHGRSLGTVLYNIGVRCNAAHCFKGRRLQHQVVMKTARDPLPHWSQGKTLLIGLDPLLKAGYITSRLKQI
jgi:hypothetical protein